MYHASVVKYRAKVAALRKQKQFHDEQQNKSNLLQKVGVHSCFIIVDFVLITTSDSRV